jgi:3D (Asp-Asp-Asp) domain-containing protein
MTTTTRINRFHVWPAHRSGTIAACGAILLLMLIGAVKVDIAADADAPSDNIALAAEAKVLDIAPKVELLRDNIPVANEEYAEAVDADVEHAIHASHKVRVMWMEVTAYCPCKECCGPGAMGLTASGKTVNYNGGAFVAADTDVLPFGTKLVIPGYSHEAPIEVIDRGGAIKGHKLDVFFDSHEEALKWGRQWVAVTVLD